MVDPEKREKNIAIGKSIDRRIGEAIASDLASPQDLQELNALEGIIKIASSNGVTRAFGRELDRLHREIMQSTGETNVIINERE